MRKTIAIVGIVIALAIGLAGGYFWGYAKGGATVVASYAPKIAEVKALFPAPMEVSSLSGQVEGISGMTLTLKAAPVTQDPFNDAFPVSREVTVTNSTKVTNINQKNQAEFQKENQDFAKKIAAGAAFSAPPLPYTETDATFSDIKVGDTVTVIAGSNILNASSFAATAVQRQVGQ